ncbi:MAG: hypothetical protein ABIC68_03855 [Candidatus Omnitrophota bacterium]
MKEGKIESKWHKFARWQRQHTENHPMLAGFMVEVFGALVLIVLSLIIVPASMEIRSDKLSDDSSIVLVKNKGFLEGDSIFKVFVDKPLKTPPVVVAGRQYVKHIVPMDENVYSIEIKDLHRNEGVEIEFKTGRIVVED